MDRYLRDQCQKIMLDIFCIYIQFKLLEASKTNSDVLTLRLFGSTRSLFYLFYESIKWNIYVYILLY